jgi:hypothetical protein
VEEVLALALAPDPSRAHEVRLALRYRDGLPSYTTRRHFMRTEWIPEVIAQGWAIDITGRFPGAVRRRHEVTPATWSGWRGRPRLKLPDARLPVGPVDYAVLPFTAATAVVDRIPPGTIVFTARRAYPHIPLAITHVGLTIPAEVPRMRHATRMSTRNVRDDRLEWYAEHLGEYVNWPADGLILLYPLEAGPTPGRLATLRSLAEPALVSAPEGLPQRTPEPLVDLPTEEQLLDGGADQRAGVLPVGKDLGVEPVADVLAGGQAGQ